MLNLNEISDYANKRNKELFDQEFSSNVTITHLDGSVFYVKHATIEYKEEWTIVYSEHHSPFYYFSDEIEVEIE